jgi:hypothetical protein
VKYEDRLAAAREHARTALLTRDAFELVFHRRESGEKLTPEEILHDWHLLRRRFTPPSPSRRKRMSEAKLRETYSRAIRKKDLKAHSALTNEAIACLLDPRSKLPALIETYVVEALEKHMMALSNKRGVKSERNFIRDGLITDEIERLEYDFDLKPTRNRAQGKVRESGCSVVASVLAEGGLHLTEQAVEKIWQHRILWP